MQATCIRWAKSAYTSAPSASHTFQRAQKGLFGGKTKMYGKFMEGKDCPSLPSVCMDLHCLSSR